MKTLITFLAASGLMLSTARAEEPWRFILLADWHMAELYVHPDRYPVGEEYNLANLKMLNENFGGELVLLPGDSNKGHWDTEEFIRSFNPALTPAEAILQAGDLCYTGMVNAFHEAGYSRLLMAVGDHEVGDNPWPPGTAVSRHQGEFREAFATVFNINPDTGEFIYDQPIGAVPSRPLGTKYETTSFAYQYRNVLFVTVDAFHQEDPDKQIGRQGSVTGAVVGEHLAWLDQVLSEAGKDSTIKHILVQSHLPVLQPVRRINSSGMLMDDEMESDFWKTLRRHEVDIFFAGEVHSNTVTKDPQSDLVQVVTRGRNLNNFATVDVTDDAIDIILYNQASPNPTDGQYEVYGRLVLDKSAGETTFSDEGELAFLDREARLIHFDFEENLALKDRPVLGFSLRNGGNPFKSEIDIEGVTCDRSFPNRGAYGHNYDAQNGNIAFAEGPRGSAGLFTPESQMAVYGAGPHGYGNMVSYALWMQTTSAEEMILLNTGRARLRGVMNLHLNDGEPVLLIADNQRLIATGRKLNDGQWHHIAVSMPKKDCLLSEVRFYIDGQLVESAVVGQDNPVSVSLANRLSIGGLGHGNGRAPFSTLIHSELGIKPFEGSLDEVSVWARGLTATEVAELAQ